MTSMNTLLSGAMDKVLIFLPYVIAGVVALALVIAFCIGVAKGFRRVSWSGLVWLAAFIGFVLLEKYGVAARLFAPLGAFATLACAVGCLLIALVLYAVFALLLRPKRVKVARAGDRVLLDKNGFEFEAESVEYDDYDDYEFDDRFYKKYKKPTVFGRLLGGLFCLVNTAAVAATVIAVALMVVHGTKIGAATPALYEMKVFGFAFVPALLPFVVDYALDFLFMGIALGIALKGRRQGFFESLRVLLMKVGALAAVVLCFYLPFSAYVAEGNILGKALYKCTQFVEYFGLNGMLAPIVAKLVTGVLFSIFVIAAFILLNWLFKKLVRAVDGVGVLRTVDSVLACLVYFAIGLVVAALVVALAYVLNHYGIFSTVAVTSGKSLISQNLFGLFEIYVEPILTQIDGAVKGIFAGFGL